MTQVTGDQWAKHMLYGTSRILKTFGVKRPIDRLGMQFLGAFNWLEANRAILYCEETMLSQGDWRQYGYSTPTQLSHVDTIFELFVQVSSFSKVLVPSTNSYAVTNPSTASSIASNPYQSRDVSTIPT